MLPDALVSAADATQYDAAFTHSQAILAAATEQAAQPVRQVVRDHRECWRRVPWLIVLAMAAIENHGWAYELYEGGHPSGPNDKAVLRVDQLSFQHAMLGLWQICRQGDMIDSFVDCRTGELIFYDPPRRTRDLTAPEVVLAATEWPASLSPGLLLAYAPQLLAQADPAIVCAHMCKYRITPLWHANDEPLDAQNATALALAASWSGTIPELLDAAELVLVP
jgi:hypothetical protein